MASEVIPQDNRGAATVLAAAPGLGGMLQGTLIRFLPVAAVAIALGVHANLPNQQTFAINEQ